jgi:two-component system NarL family sensor kinase
VPPFAVIAWNSFRSARDISGVRRDLALVNALANRLSHPLDVERALASALDTLAELLELETGWAWLWSEATESAELAATRNLPPELVAHPELMQGSDCYCLLTYAAGDLRGAANVNVVGCSRLRKLVSDSRHLRCHASVPLYVDDRRLGILNVASVDWRELTDDELNLLSTVGALVSLAIERTRLAERGATLAAAEERNRIARDIHDTIAQSLAAVTMQLESADALLEAPNPARAAETVRRALALTRSTLEEARHSVTALRTSPLAGRGLLDALRALPGEIAAPTGSRVSVRVERTGDAEALPSALEIGVYHIVREALTNVARHASATSAEVRLDARGDRLHLRVRDDGVGFDVARVSAERFGLLGMRERAHLLGGALRIDSAPGRGTTLEAELPIGRRAEHDVVATGAEAGGKPDP